MVHIKRSDYMQETEKAAQGSFLAVSSFSTESAASSSKLVPHDGGWLTLRRKGCSSLVYGYCSSLPACRPVVFCLEFPSAYNQVAVKCSVPVWKNGGQ